MKSWRTTTVAIIGTIIIILSLILVVIGKASLTEVTAFSGALGAILATALGFIAKDAKATHTKTNQK